MTEKKASSKIKCVCGTPVKEGAKFCPNCGIKYFWGDEDDEVICRGCSKKISVSDNYCPYCGRRNNIDVSTLRPTKRSAPSLSSRKILDMLIILPLASVRVSVRI